MPKEKTNKLVTTSIIVPKKPQIKSVPGVSIKERNRYRVMLADQILGDHLTLDEAIEVAGKGGKF
jgi:hypothetical protein